MQVFLTQTHLAIAMEYAQGGDMFKYICRHKPHCRLLESQARWIFQQLIIGLDYCHTKVGGCTRPFLLGEPLSSPTGCRLPPAGRGGFPYWHVGRRSYCRGCRVFRTSWAGGTVQ